MSELQPSNQTIDMDNFDVDATLEELSRKRYSMPPVVIAALRQAGQKATQRLLAMIEDDKIFNKLTPNNQLRVIEAALDRAYGKSETAASNELAMSRLSDDPKKQGDHAKQLDEIQKRAQLHANSGSPRRRLPNMSGADLLRQLDKTSPSGPYPEDGETRGRHDPSSLSDGGAPRNRPVPPNVVALRRRGDDE